MSQSHYPVHLVGSIPLTNAEDVFETVARILDDRVKRIPDGETGERSNWIAWQLPLLESSPFLEADPASAIPKHESAEDGLAVDSEDFRFLRVKEEYQDSAIDFHAKYAERAIESFETFADLQSAGKIPSNVRFQVSLPTPYAVCSLYISPTSWPAFLPAYERTILRDVEAIAAAIPHDRLAIQWDVCMEVMAWEGQLKSPQPDLAAYTFSAISRLCDAIPRGADVGLHLCYGDPGHKHIVEPKDSQILVTLANGISAATTRDLNWIHMPVPRERDDDDYFAAMSNLELDEDCELYLGLVHFTDGVEGTARRVGAARTVLSRFGIATECGFGRRPAETVIPLLDIHHQCSDLWGSGGDRVD